MTLPLDKLTWQPETWTEVILLYNNRTHRNESQVNFYLILYIYIHAFITLFVNFVLNILMIM